MTFVGMLCPLCNTITVRCYYLRSRVTMIITVILVHSGITPFWTLNVFQTLNGFQCLDPSSPRV